MTRIEYWEDEKLVFFAHSGQVALAKAKELAADLFATALEHGATKLLIDDRQMVLDLTTIDLYELIPEFDRLGFERNWKAAVVYSTSLGQAADFGFLETVAQNRGYNFRLFTDMEAATLWLGS